MKNSRVHLFISGDVTGVGYRYWTKINARELELNGFVRNEDKGLVEAVFEGEEEKVNEMVERCRKGPEVSFVRNVEVKSQKPTGEFAGFEIRQ